MGRSTIKDVAKMAGVSLATVSYVMNGRGRVTESVAARVRDAARDLGYSPNRAATALKTGQHKLIGCLLPALANPIFAEISCAIRAHAAAAGYGMILIDTKDDPTLEAEALQRLADHGVDGAIGVLNGGFRNVPLLPAFPLVSLDSDHGCFDSVRCDHAEGGREMMRQAHALGHRDIGLLGGPRGLWSACERWRGLGEAAAELGLRIRWQEEMRLDARLSEAARAALARREVTLVACVNDLVALAALGGARELGLRVPQDLSVIGFDDMAMSSWPLIALSTIRQPIERMAAEAVGLMMRRLTQPERPPEARILPIEAVMRSTSQARLRITF